MGRTFDNAIRGRELLADHRFVQGSLGLRNPYVDPLSLLQVGFLEKKRTLPEDPPIAPCWIRRWGPR